MNNWKKQFAILWSGQFVSNLTSFMVSFAVIIWLTLQTKSATVLVYATIAALLPQTILWLFSWVIVDRFDRKSLMIISDIFIAVCSLVLGYYFLKWGISIAYVYIVLALRSIAESVHIPAMQASVPLIAPAEEINKVAWIGQMVWAAAGIIAPALGGFLLTFMEIWHVMFIDVLWAIIACISLIFVKIPNPPSKHIKTHIRQDMKEGFDVLVHNRALNIVFVLFVITMFFIMPLGALFPLVVVEQFWWTEKQIWITQMMWGVGAILGWLLTWLKFAKNNIKIMSIAQIGMGIVFAICGILTHNYLIAFIWLTFIGGVLFILYYSLFSAVLQKIIPSEKLGRVFAILGTIANLPSLIWLIVTWYISDSIWSHNIFLISGLVLFIVGIIASQLPMLKKLGHKIMNISTTGENNNPVQSIDG